MVITLKDRTRDSVRIYFEKASTPEIRQFLPQKTKTVEEALTDYEKTLLPGATSFGQTVHADGNYIGDIWCYCMDPEGDPNCMVSFCVFEPEYRSKGIAARALEQFLRKIGQEFGMKTVGAFTYDHNDPSIRVLEKNGFVLMEKYEEDGVLSRYYQHTL